MDLIPRGGVKHCRGCIGGGAVVVHVLGCYSTCPRPRLTLRHCLPEHWCSSPMFDTDQLNFASPVPPACAPVSGEVEFRCVFSYSPRPPAKQYIKALRLFSPCVSYPCARIGGGTVVVHVLGSYSSWRREALQTAYWWWCSSGACSWILFLVAG